MCGADTTCGNSETTCGNSATKCLKCPWYGNGCRYGQGPNDGSRQVGAINNETKMARNVYSRRVKYTFVETYTTVASSQEEANAKFEESTRSNRNEPVGCSYGDLDAKIIEDKCEYEEEEA